MLFSMHGLLAQRPGWITRRSALKCVEHKTIFCEITKDAFVPAKAPQGFAAPKDLRSELTKTSRWEQNEQKPYWQNISQLIALRILI